MDIPNFVDAQVVDSNGKLTAVWKNIFLQLMTELQTNYSNEGLFVPVQPTTNVTKLDNNKSRASLLYNDDTNKLLISINGTFKEIQTS